jgi:hypothetical protein
MSDDQDPNPFDAKTAPLLREAFALAWKDLSATPVWKLDGEAVAQGRLVNAIMSVDSIVGLDAPTIAKRALERYRTGLF